MKQKDLPTQLEMVEYEIAATKTMIDAIEKPNNYLQNSLKTLIEKKNVLIKQSSCKHESIHRIGSEGFVSDDGPYDTVVEVCDQCGIEV